MRRHLRTFLLLTAIGAGGFSFAWACGFDDTLREYLSAPFWLPLSKRAGDFGNKDLKRLSAPYAGMGKAAGDKPIDRLRSAYQNRESQDPAAAEKLAAEARGDSQLTAREREEVDLIEAKFELRWGTGGDGLMLDRAKEKLRAFLKRAQTPEYSSEARGWLAHIFYRQGEQSAAGKIYLDELSRGDSNLSNETLVNSLRLTYPYDGGPGLAEHLEEYFDTPQHAAFAIQLATNPRWERIYRGGYNRRGDQPAEAPAPVPYARITGLLEKHRELFGSDEGAKLLALVGMRAALRAGDPPAALRIASAVPARAAVRSEPDFLWMLGSTQFLSKNYAAAAGPLLRLWRSPRASEGQKAAAAYALCGVYQKLGNPVEQIRFALWLKSEVTRRELYFGTGGIIEDRTVYWMVSGWDFGLLADAQASIESLRAFLDRYPNAAGAELVKYSLAVRLARVNRYEESALLYEAVGARTRAGRMRQMAALAQAAADHAEGKFKLAEFIAAHSERIYFNDRLWSFLQRYALFAEDDSRLTAAERKALIAAERRLKDDQEELWRAYLILREVVQESGKTPLGRRAAKLAIRCVRGINSERFGRGDEIRAADIELSTWLARP